MKIIQLSDLQSNPDLLPTYADRGEPAILVHAGEAKSLLLPMTKALLQHGTQLSLAIQFFESGILTLSSAAAMAQLSVEQFLLKLSELGVHVIKQSEAELAADLKTLGHSKTLVIETGPLVALGLIKVLPALPELFEEVYVTGPVLDNLLADSSGPAVQEISQAWKEGWIVSYPEKDIVIESDLTDLVDFGLAESIYLAKLTRGLLMADDSKTRIICKRKGVKNVGLPAFLIAAHRGGFLHRIKPALVALADAGYKLSPETTSLMLEKIG